jgi:hypothetical protein
MLSPSRFISSVYNSSWYVPFNFSPTMVSWTFLLACSEAQLKSNGGKRTLVWDLLNRKRIRQMFTYTDLLQVSFKHILISLISFKDTVSLFSHFSLQYPAKKNLIGSWFVTMKSTLMFPNNFVYVWFSSWEKDSWCTSKIASSKHLNASCAGQHLDGLL